MFCGILGHVKQNSELNVWATMSRGSEKREYLGLLSTFCIFLFSFSDAFILENSTQQCYVFIASTNPPKSLAPQLHLRFKTSASLTSIVTHTHTHTRCYILLHTYIDICNNNSYCYILLQMLLYMYITYIKPTESIKYYSCVSVL